MRFSEFKIEQLKILVYNKMNVVWEAKRLWFGKSVHGLFFFLLLLFLCVLRIKYILYVCVYAAMVIVK